MLDGGEHRHHLVNTIEPSVCGGDVAFCQITLTTCWFDDSIITGCVVKWVRFSLSLTEINVYRYCFVD